MRRYVPLMVSVSLLLGVALGGCDYVPVPDFVGPTGFCRLNAAGLVVRVGNQGSGDATNASTTRVEFPGFPSVDVFTPPVAAGSFVDLSVAIPFGCFNPDCDFRSQAIAAPGPSWGVWWAFLRGTCSWGLLGRGNLPRSGNLFPVGLLSRPPAPYRVGGTARVAHQGFPGATALERAAGIAFEHHTWCSS
jgi:hypothetical protein